MKRRDFLVPMAVLLFLFQNCSGFGPVVTGVETAASSVPIAPVSSSPTTIDASGVQSKSITATEWQPIQVQLPTNAVLTSTTLPTGAGLDASGTFRWIPKVGQAGSYEVDFSDATGATADKILLTVSAIASKVVATGPIDSLQDGDVGFVFVHGMGLEDYCANPNDLAAYWNGTPAVLSRGVSPTTLSCYNAIEAADAVAPSVAQQILAADCGRFSRCIVVTHSMGGLVMEHILTHDRAATSTDPNPALFANAALYAQVKARTLAVISIASASGGAIAATELNSATKTASQTLAAQLAASLGYESDASKSLVIANAADILNPVAADPQTPIYMVAGFTVQTSGEAGITMTSAFLTGAPDTVYQGNKDYAAIDPVVLAPSRMDGTIEFRSSCGVASDSETDGPGYNATLAQQLSYCYSSTKRTNHFVWFLTNLNHTLNPTPYASCADAANPCEILDPNADLSTFTPNSSLAGSTAVNAIRVKMDANRSELGASPIITF